jgi:hypothetical protein
MYAGLHNSSTESQKIQKKQLFVWNYFRYYKVDLKNKASWYQHDKLQRVCNSLTHHKGFQKHQCTKTPWGSGLEYIVGSPHRSPCVTEWGGPLDETGKTEALYHSRSDKDPLPAQMSWALIIGLNFTAFHWQ